MAAHHSTACLLLALACAGCGTSATLDGTLALDLARTRQAGTGPAYRPIALGDREVSMGRPVGGLRCRATDGALYGTHIELFARDRGLVIPAGIGIAPPQRRRGPFVLGGRCSYPLRTVDPTGVIEVDRAGAGSTPTVGELFALWGQPLSRQRLGAFHASRGGAVMAFVGGRRWRGDPRSIPLRRHAQIVLELGPFVEPHPTYLFPHGL